MIKLNLSKRTEHMSPEVISVVDPGVSKFEMNTPVNFNIIRMVQDAGPRRITEIAKELSEIKSRTAILQDEMNKITKLIHALEDGETENPYG